MDAVQAAKLDSLVEDLGEMRKAIDKLADAYARLAVIEERQSTSREAMDRAFRAIDTMDTRLKILEAAAPGQKQAADWVNRVIGVVITAVLTAVITTVVVRGPTRAAIAPPALERPL